MRNWFNWDWEEIFSIGSIFAVILGILICLVPLGFSHYHKGLGPDVTAQPIRFLLDWFGIVGVYVVYIVVGAVAGLVVGLFFAIMLAGYADYICANEGKRRLALDSYTSYVVLTGLLVGFGSVVYGHAMGYGRNFVELFVSYLLTPLLVATGMFVVWILLLEIGRQIIIPLVARR